MKWFWLVLTVAALLWYSGVTIYVAIRGAADIRQMLTALGQRRDADKTVD